MFFKVPKRSGAISHTYVKVSRHDGKKWKTTLNIKMNVCGCVWLCVFNAFGTRKFLCGITDENPCSRLLQLVVTVHKNGQSRKRVGEAKQYSAHTKASKTPNVNEYIESKGKEKTRSDIYCTISKSDVHWSVRISHSIHFILVIFWCEIVV